MIPAPSRALAAALAIAASATACSGATHTHHTALPAGPQQMTATVDAVQVGASGGCARNRVGGGLTDGHVVLTTASLVAGAATVQVTNAQGTHVSGRVVALDADTDVAWVYAPGLPSVRIGPAQQSDRVVPAYLFAFGADGRAVTYRAQTLERTTTTTQDVFGMHQVRRDIYRLHLDSPATVPLSGAPVLDSSGNLLGIASDSADSNTRTVDVVAGDDVARSAATRSLSGQDPATMATSAGARCATAVSASS